MVLAAICFLLIQPSASLAEEKPESNWTAYAYSNHVFTGVWGSWKDIPDVAMPAADEFEGEEGEVATILRTYPNATGWIGCNAETGLGGQALNLCPPVPDMTDPDEPEFIPPTTEEIIIAGVGSTVVAGSGLVVNPSAMPYVGIPTLVHATTTTQTLSIRVLDYDVPIYLHANWFSFDFNDGTPPLITSDPGAPYPAKINYHVYTEPFETNHITLITQWSGTATNPFTGQTVTIQGVVHTLEVSPDFEVRKAHTAITDLAEENNGH